MKIKLLLTTLLLLPFLSTSWAQCEEEDAPRILLLGDSWAFFMNADGTFNNVLDHWGHSDKIFYSNPDLSVSGARTEDFLTMSRLTEIQTQLEAHPTIDVAHISLSGNDFLGNWNVDFTEAETEELSDETYDEVIELVDFIRGVRPDIHIVFSGYMYANFAEVIADAEPFEESHPFYGNWEEMGFPTFEQLNSLLNDFSDRMYDFSLSDPKIDFVHVPALMQYVYGQEEPLGVPPGGTYAPFSQPLPYGDITYPSPKACMRNYGLVRDCFHLSEEGYFYMIDYQFQKFYHKFLMDDAYLFASLDSENGSVSGDGDIDARLRIGEADGVENKVILSFDMSTVPDTVITAASIFIRRDSLVGTDNPLGATAQLTMASGNLGSSVDVDTEDFSATGDITATACVFGMNEEDDNWLRIELPEEFLPLISNDDQMQFSIAIAGSDVDELHFTDGADPEFAPVLNLKYKSEFVGLEEDDAKDDLVIFPNPVKDHLTLFSKSAIAFDQVEVLNLQGQVVYSQVMLNNQIDLRNLTPGNYILRAWASSGVVVESFIKQ